MEAIYERWGPELFDKIWSSTGFNDQQTSLIADGLKSASKILDLGTGIGNVAQELLKRGKTVYGVDISQRMLDYTTRKISSPHFVPVIRDANDLHYVSEFDGAYCASNMAYFDDIGTVVENVYRALRPSGLFAVTGYERDRMHKWADLTGQESRKAIEEGRVSLNEGELKKLAEAVNEELTTIDSSDRTRNTLRANGFTVLRDEKFYHDTSYFILAQKV